MRTAPEASTSSFRHQIWDEWVDCAACECSQPGALFCSRPTRADPGHRPAEYPLVGLGERPDEDDHQLFLVGRTLPPAKPSDLRLSHVQRRTFAFPHPHEYTPRADTREWRFVIPADQLPHPDEQCCSPEPTNAPSSDVDGRHRHGCMMHITISGAASHYYPACR
jgi:hypothetical protein